jgi:hypothetical protein
MRGMSWRIKFWVEEGRGWSVKKGERVWEREPGVVYFAVGLGMGYRGDGCQETVRVYIATYREDSN